MSFVFTNGWAEPDDHDKAALVVSTEDGADRTRVTRGPWLPPFAVGNMSIRVRRRPRPRERTVGHGAADGGGEEEEP